MNDMPIVLIPGLFCTARLYVEQIPALWQCGAVTVADHRRDDSMAQIARRILENAPPKFALAGLSMGGYIAFEIMRQAPERVAKLALLDTAAQPDTPESTRVRKEQIEQARNGGYGKLVRAALPMLLHRQSDEALRNAVIQMAEESGTDVFIRQQQAIMGRADSRPTLASIACPTLVVVGEQDKLTPPERSKEIAAGIAGAQLVIVPECGHISTLEQPQAVTQALVNWLRQ